MDANSLRVALTEARNGRDAAERERDEWLSEIARLAREADGLLSVAEFARIAGVTRQTVYNMRS
ncbi:MAG: hypothetical protein H0W36_10445 [Gemmatimonadetes bacterium]|nr:hypothetical protein [Gemmatimonadota bacterium]